MMLQILGWLVLLFSIPRILQFLQLSWSLRRFPGFRTLLGQNTILGNLLPAIPGISLGGNSMLNWKHEMLERFGCDVLVNVSVFPLKPYVVIADATLIQEIAISRARFPKPVKEYESLMFFGRNIVASEGDEWKKYRKISAPSFSNNNNRLVWSETVAIMQDMFENVWGKTNAIDIDHCADMTIPITISLIGGAGFGRKVSWKDDLVVPPGHKITFKDALHQVSTGVFIKLLVPKWAMSLTERLRNIQMAFDELDQYMNEMIRDRRNLERKDTMYDLFNSLLDANDRLDSSEVGAKLTDEELIGNIFMFLTAGHETTANTLCYMFALLALYQAEQEKLYQHIMSVLQSNEKVPKYEEMPLFTRSLAVLYETLRMFPTVIGIPKCSAEDTMLVTVDSVTGQRTVIPILKGTDIAIDVVGVHYNARHWKDPEDFKPERFLTEDWPKNAFIPFGVGSRACIGRKFFETAATAILAMLVPKYKIEVKEEPQYAKETFQERKARLLQSKPGLTLTPVRVPLVFTRRH